MGSARGRREQPTPRSSEGGTRHMTDPTPADPTPPPTASAPPPGARAGVHAPTGIRTPSSADHLDTAGVGGGRRLPARPASRSCRSWPGSEPSVRFWPGLRALARRELSCSVCPGRSSASRGWRSAVLALCLRDRRVEDAAVGMAPRRRPRRPAPSSGRSSPCSVPGTCSRPSSPSVICGVVLYYLNQPGIKSLFGKRLTVTLMPADSR